MKIMFGLLLLLCFRLDARDARVATPTPSQPPQGATGVPINVQLVWSIEPGATIYHVQIGTDSLFSRVLVDDSVPPFTYKSYGPLSYNTIYYWHVNAGYNSAGTTPYSPTWHFTTTTQTAIKPVQVSLKHLSLKSDGVLKFSLPQKSSVKILIYDSKGAVVKTLVNETREKGSYTISLPKEFLEGARLLDFTAGKFHKAMKLP